MTILTNHLGADPRGSMMWNIARPVRDRLGGARI